MISKESADAIAQVLLEQAHGELNQRKNAMARRRSWLYQFPELKQFQPWQRDVITRRCAELVNREPVTIALLMVWLSCVMAVAFAFPMPFPGISRGPLIVFAGLALLAFHRWRVRQNVRAFVEFVRERLDQDRVRA
jgi:hypothetical protein